MKNSTVFFWDQDDGIGLSYHESTFCFSHFLPVAFAGSIEVNTFLHQHCPDPFALDAARHDLFFYCDTCSKTGSMARTHCRAYDAHGSVRMEFCRAAASGSKKVIDVLRKQASVRYLAPVAGIGSGRDACRHAEGMHRSVAVNALTSILAHR